MRISIDGIPATPEVLECFLDEEGIDALKRTLNAKTAHVTKYVDAADVGETFIGILKAVLALPNSKVQPSVDIGIM